MRDAHVERAVLIGHSLGGPIAYAFLRLFPEKAKALVLVDAFVSRHMAGPAGPRRHRRLFRQDRPQFSRPRRARRTSPSASNPASPRKHRNALRAEIRAKMYATPKHVRIAALSSISSLPPPPEDETFDLPAIAIQAAEPATQARFDLMRTIFPRMQLDRWEGAGHFLMLEDPARFNREVEQFLASF